MIYIPTDTLISIGITVLIFGIVVLVHEWGHFIAARKNGIFVEEFAIGMGPKLFSYQKNEDSTLYSLRAFPVGGFCRMHGDDEESANSPRAFGTKKVWQRMSVMLAGSFMNFLLAFVIFFGMFMFGGSLVFLPVVYQTVEGTPADLAGLQSGDKITHINGSRVHLFEDLGIMLASNGGQPIDLRIRRDGRAQTLTLTPHLNDDGVYRMGFYPVRRTGLSGELTDGLTRISLWESISIAFNHIIFFIKMTILFLVQLITRAGPTPEVVGIVGFFDIIETTYQVTLEQSASSSLTTSQLFTQMLTRMLTLCALLSANLGIFNLLPLPALDGGRLVFLTLEGIRRKPVSQEKESLVHLVGFALLIGLAIFITYQDILKRL